MSTTSDEFEESMPEDSGGPFICPECGAGEESCSGTILVSPSFRPGNAWSNVLEWSPCITCGSRIPTHLTERWGGMSPSEASAEWRSTYRREGLGRKSSSAIAKPGIPDSGSTLLSNSQSDSGIARPFASLTTEMLTEIFSKSRSDGALLSRIESELQHRKRPRAIALLAEVQAAIKALA